MKFIARLILISLFALLMAQFLPWWSIIFCSAFMAFVLPGSNINAFISGFLGIGLLWMIVAWTLDVEANSILSSKVVQLLPRVNDPAMLVVLTGVLGGVVGGFSAFTGNSFRQIFIKKKKASFYN